MVVSFCKVQIRERASRHFHKESQACPCADTPSSSFPRSTWVRLYLGCQSAFPRNFYVLDVQGHILSRNWFKDRPCHVQQNFSRLPPLYASMDRGWAPDSHRSKPLLSPTSRQFLSNTVFLRAMGGFQQNWEEFTATSHTPSRQCWGSFSSFIFLVKPWHNIMISQRPLSIKRKQLKSHYRPLMA